MPTIHFYDLVSILGVTLILGSYFLLQLAKIDAQGYPYSLLNILGSLMILYSLLYDWNLSAVIIEIFWAAISLIGVIRRFMKK